MKLDRLTPQHSGRVPLRCKWEQPSAIANEILVLAKQQQAEVGEDYEPFDPDWERWLAIERAP